MWAMLNIPFKIDEMEQILQALRWAEVENHNGSIEVPQVMRESVTFEIAPKSRSLVHKVDMK